MRTKNNLYRDIILLFSLIVTQNIIAQEIQVSGNNIEIISGDTTPSITNYTDFGTANLGTQITRSFIIENTDTTVLNITSITLSNTTDFSIITTIPTSIPALNNETLTITFNSITLGTTTSIITIESDDSDESTYTFTINATAEQNFFDSDGDGVLDNIDIDDDNDGITDIDEETACSNSFITPSANYKFLNETFGTGSRTTINTTYDAHTTYCYEDGTVGTNTTECPNQSSIHLNDGKYTVYYKAGNGDGIDDTPNEEVSSWADDYWYTGEDHTANDSNGRMALFNASETPGTFYTAEIIGALPNIPITYSFWILNLDTTDAPDINNRLRPNILVEFRDVNNTILASITTGDIPPSINGDPENSWHQFTADLILNTSEFYVYFINNEVGGAGNDLALDDIVISQTLCDTDGDDVANLFDLDSDNDGIPDVVEAGLGNESEGKATLTNTSSWVDSNNNGMHDLFESHSALDSDGDGTPNYLDLDSDNDTLFDVDESGAGNTADINHINEDGDITGDGVGDGPDTDATRETDKDSDGSIEYYPDGILDLYDYFEGGTFSTSYGNSNQGSTGTGWGYYVKDTDNDGTPDYLDLTSDGSTFDISKTLYANLDADNDGLIDDTTDTEGDGIIDLFDTDTSRFGSPRDLDRKLQLYFDGRNDYANETTVINEWEEVSIMTWIKIDDSATGDQFILGQNEFYIQLNSNKSITASANGTNITYATPLTTNRWIHIASTYLNGDFKLYINGVEEANISITGSINTDTSSFTLGKTPDTNTNYFHGYLDEVRLFNKALSENELHKIIYQEIENNSGNIRGNIIPRDITDFVDEATITPLIWSALQRYYKMDTYKDDIIDNLTTEVIDVDTGAKIYNTKIINTQSAPLPFTTQKTGNLTTALDIAVDGVNGNDAITYDWSIVKIAHNNVNFNAYQKHLALIIEAPNSTPIEYSVENDSELNISWYLYINGTIDLEGESQLIQGPDSYFDVTSPGVIESDQQGTKDLYTYNYWSSPVGISNIKSNNNKYTLPDILNDGSVASTPLPITFITGTTEYNGTPGTPGTTAIGIADYWIWKYANSINNNYSQWEHVRSTDSISAGEGFTMKGVDNTATSFSETQNYVFNGKPNNGDINLTISAENDYLIGNPYPSALDADEFIKDNLSSAEAAGRNINGNIINGALYFWDHFAVNSHALKDYQGGYATYTLMGGVKAVSTDNRINASGVEGTKIPERFIPIGQGFFVSAILDADLVDEDDNPIVVVTQPVVGGSIVFKNSQRVFQKESITNSNSGSLFLKSNSNNKTNSKSKIDTRSKIRLMFHSPNGYHRQLLIGADENTSNNFDIGYDAILNDPNKEDMYWTLSSAKLVIQAVNNFNDNQNIPFNIKIHSEGIASISIDDLKNIDASKSIFVHDKKLNLYHDLTLKDYEIFLTEGEHTNRFEITFSINGDSTLGTNSNSNNSLEIFFSNNKQSIIINNPKLKTIQSLKMYNILGQIVFELEKKNNLNYLEFKTEQITSGAYIIKLKTEQKEFSKKVLVK